MDGHSSVPPKKQQQSRKRRRNSAAAEKQSNTTTVTTAGVCICVGDRYETLQKLGKGTYGVVYKARDILSQNKKKMVALKRCLPHHESTDGFGLHTLREIESLRICAACPFIVTLENIAVSSSSVFLILEYCQHDLANLIDNHYLKNRNAGSSISSPFTQQAVKTLFRHLLHALDFCHSHHLIHRDVKLSNLLYTDAGYLKLADFGLSRHYWEESSSSSTMMVLTQKVASLWYRPPEILLGCRRYTQSIDVWAAACSFAELLKGVPLLNEQTEERQIERIFHDVGLPPNDYCAIVQEDYPLIRDHTVQLPSTSSSRRRFRLLDKFPFLSEAGCQLLTCLLQWDPKQRWTAAQALRSPYFSEAPLPVPEHQMPRFPAASSASMSPKNHPYAK